MSNYKWVILICVSLNSCKMSNSQTPPLYNASTFNGSYRKLVDEIDQEDTVSMERLVVRENLNVNYKESTYGISLLKWAVTHRKYYSFRKLLELGANPNQTDTILEYVPVITVAAKIKDNSSYLEQALKFGGNPNVPAGNLTKVQYTDASPLCAASSASLRNVQVLIARGAEINFSPYSSFLPLTTALIADKIDIAKYLIIDKSADVNKVFTVRIHHDTARIGDLLRLNVYPLDSDEYKLKMRIVDYLKGVGINYRSSQIPQYLYDDYSKEFLRKY